MTIIMGFKKHTHRTLSFEQYNDFFSCAAFIYSSERFKFYFSQCGCDSTAMQYAGALEDVAEIIR